MVHAYDLQLALILALLNTKYEESGGNVYIICRFKPWLTWRFSTELNQVGRRELVYSNCALHHFKINSFSLEVEFKPELRRILSRYFWNF